jgi:hypothetical protein
MLWWEWTFIFRHTKDVCFIHAADLYNNREISHCCATMTNFEVEKTISIWEIILMQKKFEDTKYLEEKNWRRTDNEIAKRKRTKGQTMIDKILQKGKIEEHKLN